MEFDRLSRYFFEEMGTGDERALEAGADNLVTWLDRNLDEVMMGYEVADLSQRSLDELEVVKERDPTKLVGGAVATVGASTLDELANALLLPNQKQIYPDTYDVYERNFRDDRGCFLEGDCTELLVDNDAVTRLPLGIRLTSSSTVHYRWVDGAEGPVLLTRSWLQEPATSDLLRLEDQFFLSANLETDDGVVRITAVWADTAFLGIDVPEASALNILIGQLQEMDGTLHAWIAR